MAGPTENRGSLLPHATKGIDGQLARLVAGVCFADLLLICAGATVEIDPFIVLFARVVLLAICTRCFPPTASDWTLRTFILMLLLIAGPLGAIGAVVLIAAERRGTIGQDVLEAWYDRLSGGGEADPGRRLHEAIVAGRGFKPARHGPRGFPAVMEHGTLPEKQALLGHIGLKYHRDYYPLLCSALRSPQSIVRAQAAAVFVKLKEQLKLCLHDHRRSLRAAQSNDDVPAMLACARSILDCAESGFLDPSEARDALAEAKALCLMAAPPDTAGIEQAEILCRIIAASGEDDGWLDRLRATAPASRSQLRQLLAPCLMATGRHMELHKLLFPDEDQASAGAHLRPLVPAGGQ